MGHAVTCKNIPARDALAACPSAAFAFALSTSTGIEYGEYAGGGCTSVRREAAACDCGRALLDSALDGGVRPLRVVVHSRG